MTGQRDRRQVSATSGVSDTPVAATIARTETNWNIDGNWLVQGPGSENWSADDWLNDKVAPAFDDWMDTAGRSTGCRLDVLKVYPIGTDGKAIPAPPYGSGTPVTLTWTSGNPLGATSGNLMPINNAVVASHRTAQVGRSGRGRMFIPGLAAGAVSAEGLVDSTVRGFLLNAQVALLEAISDIPGGLVTAEVVPCITGGSFTQYASISQVRMGNVFDTQNRRRRQLVENYSSATVTY